MASMKHQCYFWSRRLCGYRLMLLCCLFVYFCVQIQKWVCVSINERCYVMKQSKCTLYTISFSLSSPAHNNIHIPCSKPQNVVCTQIKKAIYRLVSSSTFFLTMHKLKLFLVVHVWALDVLFSVQCFIPNIISC